MRSAPFVLLALVVVVLVVTAIGLHGRSVRRGVFASGARTPGVLNPAVTQATIRWTICVRGWTRTIRPPVGFTNRLKARQMREYGESGPLSAYQEDHLISLELGGHPTDPRNLWPEPRTRAEEVDRIENELNAEICAGKISLAEGQRRISAIKHRDG